jgi:hypothetical protein
MLIYLTLLIPIFVTLGVYLFHKHRFTWWEFFIPIGVTLIVIVLTKLIFDTTNLNFDEWWGSSVVEVYEEEPSNEWVHKTCEDCWTDSDGEEHCTEYDCSYQSDSGPSWYMRTDIGERVYITEVEYEHMKKLWGTPRISINEHRNHSPRDYAVSSRGTKFEDKRVGEISYTYRCSWNNVDSTRVPFASRRRYVNRVKASDLTIFNISIVTDAEADSLKLFKYPEHGPRGNDGLYFPTILGGNVPDDIHQMFRQLNGKFGVSDSLRLWVLIYPVGTPEVNAAYQENYWVKGNKNELVVCLSLDRTGKLAWAHSFSWGMPTGITEASKTQAVYIETFDHEGWVKYAKWFDENLHDYKQRDFIKEFSYLKLKPTKASIITIIILSILASFGTNIWVIKNDISDEW